MKKLITLIILILTISGCQKASTMHIQKDTSLSGIHEIDYQSLQEKLNSNELFVLYIGRPDCKDCQEFYPILTSYIEENEGTYLYYLNIQAFRDARPICTSGPLRTSTRVSSGFALPRHSSPSFGS